MWRFLFLCDCPQRNQHRQHHQPKFSYLAIGHRLTRNEQLWIDSVQVPFERLTLEIVTQLHSLGNIAEISLIAAYPLVIVFRIVIQPHLGQTN